MKVSDLLNMLKDAPLDAEVMIELCDDLSGDWIATHADAVTYESETNEVVIQEVQS